MKKYLPCIVVSGMILFVSGCSTLLNNTITQVSTIDALLCGIYDGEISCRRLMENGNFGIGTFSQLEGEMVILNGTLYQIKADGKVYKPHPNIKTPFAAVCRFNIDKTFRVKNGTDFKTLEEQINKHAPNKNIFCAIKIKGKFARMKTRSVPKQNKPYPPLKEVTRNQPEFHMKNVSGTIVGFRCPSYVKGINVPGYHLHFITDDRKQGGHVLEMEMTEAECHLDLCNKFFMILPDKTETFADIDLSKDRSRELQEVEK